MMKSVLGGLGKSAVHAVAGGRLMGSRLNIKLGFALLRDRRIGVWPKLLALAIGGVGTALLIGLEIAPEAILGAILPALGLALDVVADGLEVAIVPFLLAALALPFVAPRALVEEIMAERAGLTIPALPPPTSA